MTTPRVANLLEDIRRLSEVRFSVVQALRQLVLNLDPGVTEEVKYGGLLFSLGKPFCGVFAYAKHVSLEFGGGASLPDEHHVLEGEGKLRRHITAIAHTNVMKQVSFTRGNIDTEEFSPILRAMIGEFASSSEATICIACAGTQGGQSELANG